MNELHNYLCKHLKKYDTGTAWIESRRQILKALSEVVSPEAALSLSYTVFPSVKWAQYLLNSVSPTVTMVISESMYVTVLKQYLLCKYKVGFINKSNGRDTTLMGKLNQRTSNTQFQELISQSVEVVLYTEKNIIKNSATSTLAAHLLFLPLSLSDTFLGEAGSRVMKTVRNGGLQPADKRTWRCHKHRGVWTWIRQLSDGCPSRQRDYTSWGPLSRSHQASHPLPMPTEAVS